MFDSPSQCIRPSDKVVSEHTIALLGRLPLEILLVLRPCVSKTRSGPDLLRDFQPKAELPPSSWRFILVYRLALPLAPIVWGGPVCYPGYSEQNRPGNGTERSACGGCHPSTDGLCAPNPLEKSYSPFGPRRSSRKRGSDNPQSSRASSKGGTPRTFACHFYLHDRIGHSACLNIRLGRLSDVRQHLLERTHNQVVHCAVCGTTFPGRATEARRLRDAHVLTATCQPSPSPLNYPGITEDEERRIRDIARNTRTADYDDVRRWFMIWDCLFPGEQRPESPFLTDIPEIQRVSDWAGVIFSDTDRWLALPNEPWTPAMSPEEQNARMANFIQSFITEARDLVEEESGPVEDWHGADNSSYVNFDTPDPSVTTTNLGVSSLASSDSNRPANASRGSSLNPISATGSRRSSINPISATGSRRSSINPVCATGSTQAPSQPSPHTLGATALSTGEQPAVIAPLPYRPLDEPNMDVPQDIQQRAASGPAMGLDDPALPSWAFQDFSAELGIDSGFDWFSSLNGCNNTGNVWGSFVNDDADPDNSYTPPDDDEDRGRH